MIHSYINYISEIVYRLCISDGMTIKELSRISQIEELLVAGILMNVYEVSFGGLILEPYGLEPDEDIFEIDIHRLHNKIVWKIDTILMEKMPTQILTGDELLILSRLAEENQVFKLPQTTHNKRTDDPVLIKGLSANTDELLHFEHYLKLRKAIVQKKQIELTFVINNNQTHKMKASPIGIVFNTERQIWFLIILHSDLEPEAIEINEIHKIELLDRRASITEFDMMEYLRQCFDLGAYDAYEVEVNFENHGNILKKVKRKLSGRGKIQLDGDGRIVFKGMISGIDSFKRWMLSFGSSGRIIEPQWLADEQIEEWQRICQNYER